MSAATSARRVDPELEIIVLERTGFASWGVCGIPYYVSGVVARPEDLISVTPDEFADRHIDIRLHHEVTAIDASRRSVGLADGSELSYDRLVVAAGAVPSVPPIPGIGGRDVHFVRTLEGAIALRRRIEAGSIDRALVVGAGYVGLEMAESLVESGAEVTVVEVLPRVMPTIDAELGELVQSAVARHVDLRLSSGLVAVEDGRARLDDGTELAADAVVVAAGIRPGSREAAAAGAASLEGGALVVDDHMRTSLPDVFAAGDCIAVHHVVLGRSAHVALGPTANKTGRVAGMNAAGADVAFAGIVGTAVAKIFELTVARTGLTLEEATREGIDARAADSTARSKAKYYPGSAPTHTRLVFRPDSRLLGAQMISTDPATAKRIDVIATALHAGFDIDHLGALDLSYAPPYAPVYDPILRAAQAADKAIARRKEFA
jgi:NADPH-dependent 2,4-dienoyl-CoA reductase/sulfur reductase-like enzyme